MSGHIARVGIKTSVDFARWASALIADVADDRIAPHKSNAMCNAAGKLLKVVEMQIKYGKETQHGLKVLQLVNGQDGVD